MMKAIYRVLRAPMLIAVALLASACEREMPIEPTPGPATSIDGVPIKYEVAGQGEPALVFVHCWSCNRGFWDAQMAYFAPRYRVVRLDLAGHGESGRGRADYTIAAFGADVAAVVEQLDLKQVVLIGHSMGGPVAAEAERRLGSKLRNINADPKGENRPLHASVVLIAGVGHFIAQGKPAEFNHVLEGIVRDLRHAEAQSATDNRGTRLLRLLTAHDHARRSVGSLDLRLGGSYLLPSPAEEPAGGFCHGGRKGVGRPVLRHDIFGRMAAFDEKKVTSH